MIQPKTNPHQAKTIDAPKARPTVSPATAAWLLLSLIIATTSSLFAAEERIVVNSKKILRHTERHRLIGTNLAVWDYPTRYNMEKTQDLLRAWKPALVRIPGGSWSDAYYWNGNGVALEKQVQLDHGYQTNRWLDPSSFQNGAWQVDYGGYAPGFAINDDQTPQDFHGNLDIASLHQYLESVAGASAVVTVNAGTGTPKMAAEWVRWAKNRGHSVDYWEVGNELEGSWEPGHFLKDGSAMNGEIYAKRFREFASAMKRVDPSIKIGGATSGSAAGGFSEAMLKYSGDWVDFVSFHHYPTGESIVSDDHLFGKIDELGAIVERFRSWITIHQPERAKAIELGITEWNIKLPEDQQTADLTSGLWTSAFVGEMMKTGIDFANQWDLFTIKHDGGHGALHFSNQGVQAKSQYWAFWMWSKLMGNELLEVKAVNKDKLRAYATVIQGGHSVMIINTDRRKQKELQWSDLGADKNSKVHSYTLSNLNYFWNPIAKRPEWSTPPHRQQESTTAKLTVPPFSVKVVHVLNENHESSAQSLKKDIQELFPGIQYCAPKETSLGKPTSVFAMSRDLGNGQPIGLKRKLKLWVSRGQGLLSEDNLMMDRAVNGFLLIPQKTGTIEISASYGDVMVTPPLKIKVRDVQLSRKTLWSFENENQAIKSSFVSSRNGNILPNVHVWDVHLNGRTPQRGNDDLFALKSIPRNIEKSSLRGVFAKVGLSKGFTCHDPSAKIHIVLQSEGKHWIPLHSAPLSQWQGGTDFKTIEGQIDTELEPLMSMIYNVKITITSILPIHGHVYLDDIGFLLEHE